MAHIHNKDLSIFMAFIVCKQYRSCYYSKLVINNMYWWLPVGNWRAMSATTFRFLWQWFSIDSNDRACSCKTHRIYNKFQGPRIKDFFPVFKYCWCCFVFWTLSPNLRRVTCLIIPMFNVIITGDLNCVWTNNHSDGQCFGYLYADILSMFQISHHRNSTIRKMSICHFYLIRASCRFKHICTSRYTALNTKTRDNVNIRMLYKLFILVQSSKNDLFIKGNMM